MEHTDGKKYTYDDFLEIIQTLRSENGCPWDREQTHTSLKPCLMEEAAEVLAAIRIYDETGNFENLREELGDVLLQVVMHAQIAKEEGLFTMEDVVSEVAEKMVRRHPHVFGEVQADSSEQVLSNWEEIKKKEKENKTYIQSPLTEIPRELPALTRAVKVLKKVDKFYEPAQDYVSAVKKLSEASKQLSNREPNTNDSDIETLVGDVLMAVSDVSRICKLSQEQILTDRIEEMIDRYEKP
uniref:nucleoside triphosphate pyrophosphohydrolase n=1 Tax=Acetatifactor sp. TaxID=1872090 RepID=UPI004056FAFB